MLYVLYGLDDIAQRRHFIAQSSEEPEFLRRDHQRLALLIGFSEGGALSVQSPFGGFR